MVRYLVIRIDKQKLSSDHLPKVCDAEKEQGSPGEGIQGVCLIRTLLRCLPKPFRGMVIKIRMKRTAVKNMKSDRFGIHFNIMLYFF